MKETASNTQTHRMVYVDHIIANTSVLVRSPKLSPIAGAGLVLGGVSDRQGIPVSYRSCIHINTGGSQEFDNVISSMFSCPV